MEAIAEQGSTLLDSISAFCRSNGIAESTFGRRAVNDGKFVARLRDGARITPETLDRVTVFLERHGGSAPPAAPARIAPADPGRRPRDARNSAQSRAKPRSSTMARPPAISASSTTGRSTCCS